MPQPYINAITSRFNGVAVGAPTTTPSGAPIRYATPADVSHTIPAIKGRAAYLKQIRKRLGIPETIKLVDLKVKVGGRKKKKTQKKK